MVQISGQNTDIQKNACTDNRLPDRQGFTGFTDDTIFLSVNLKNICYLTSKIHGILNGPGPWRLNN